MGQERTFAVTLIKAGRGIPSIEVGAYTYTAEWLPRVGETIPLRLAAAPEGADGALHGYVTKVNPVSDTPISVVEVVGQSMDDDVVVQPVRHVEAY
jgi:hypothetical protein